jgi:molybdopterin synthase catalytic subunit
MTTPQPSDRAGREVQLADERASDPDHPQATIALEAMKIVHRVRRVALGDAVVLVVVAAPHRGAAFDACEFLMDFLKAHAPLWKKEIRRDGAVRWVEAKTRDEQSMLRWG